MHSELLKSVSRKALCALTAEVTLTPKPGLVDKSDSGAHNDVTYALFKSSAQAISPFMGECAESAYRNSPSELYMLFPPLREIGLRAEKEMLLKTGGVNTHKGAVFCFSVLSGAYGSLLKEMKPFSAEDILLRAGEISRPFMLSELSGGRNETAGEKAYAAHGLRSARLEAAEGYPSISEHALPQMRSSRSKGLSQSACLLRTLYTLMLHADDTCIFARGGLDGLRYCKKAAAEALCAKDIFSFSAELNSRFIQRNLSPGGSADLLAATIFIMLLTSEIREEEL